MLNSHTPVDGPVAIGKRILTPGDTVRILHERGTFRYTDGYWTADGHLVLNFIGGPPGHYAMRSFYPDRVRFPPKKRTPK